MHRTLKPVAIGVAVYNGSRYIRDCLEAIRVQSFVDFDVIISDNASTDDTKQICMEYVAADTRFAYYRNERNLGFAPNYNRVFDLSNAKYFKWADHDDLIEPDFVLKTVDVLERNPEVAICLSRVTIINDVGAVMHNYDPLPDTSSPIRSNRFRKLILSPDLAVHSLGMMRSNLIRRTAKFGSFPASDEVFLAHMALLGKFHEMPERLIKVRFHSGQSTAGPRASQRGRVTLFDTSNRNKFVPVKWTYFQACLNAIRHTALTSREKAACYLTLLRWLLTMRHLKPMIKDVLLMTHEWVPIFARLYQGALDEANAGKDPS